MAASKKDPREVKIDLARLMRRHKVTIRDLAKRMGITMKRIREVREMDRIGYLAYCDYVQAVTGENVFFRARWERMCSEWMQSSR